MSGLFSLVVFLVVWFVTYAPLAGVFAKAGREWWAAFIPFYNIYVLLTTVGRPGWWLVLFFIPVVNIVIFIIVAYDLAKSFGHGAGFTIGLVILTWIFALILWLGGSQYRGPSVGQHAVA